MLWWYAGQLSQVFLSCQVVARPANIWLSTEVHPKTLLLLKYYRGKSYNGIFTQGNGKNNYSQAYSP